MSAPLSQMSELDVLWSNFCAIDRRFKREQREKVVKFQTIREREQAADAFAAFVKTMRTDA